MSTKIRRVALWVIGSFLAMSGLSYAGTGAPNPVKAALDAITGPGANQSSDPTPSPSPTPTATPAVTPTPEPTAAAASASPQASPDAEHGVTRSTEGCPPGFTGNHGQFVSGTQERPRSDAARSPCGKPAQSVHSPNPAGSANAQHGQGSQGKSKGRGPSGS